MPNMKLYDMHAPNFEKRKILGIAALEGKKFTLGGAYLLLSKSQLSLVRMLFTYPKTKFRVYDLASYVNTLIEPEVSLTKMIEVINHKCYMAKREKLIKRDGQNVFLNPSVLQY